MAQYPELRFAFGKNWLAFLAQLDDQRIADAEASIRQLFEVDQLQGRRFLDAGCGSGLFSLAARRLGATVVSFDYDPESVACTQELKRRYAPDDDGWTIGRGSVLDRDFLVSLGQFDFVYSWGVLHHTGAMWEAIGQIRSNVANGGYLCLSIYNDQGRSSERWSKIKRLYCRLPWPFNTGLVVTIGVGLWGLRMASVACAMLLRIVTLRNPFAPLINWIREQTQRRARGMHPWYDLVDWVGGWPFEVAKPGEVFRYVRDGGFVLTHLATCGGGWGCNEFVFQRQDQPILETPRHTN
ncbi:MAG: methyltransferase domain-containing protein [Planctomycetaceae bacterium]|nr:methyltransferase domain-containing protein [Planctomycetales bacterium]MCA9145133.1 methyltransferase domain-containing protein [Planctomycetales bacterium]MCB9873277.1 methyltransferase domain-containing protein [Planctomycetaceae bacterium]MCB9939424.1 methyltransferase domain-containing protein [Planctomycetaceae bacterium]HRX79823.1 class I SAM-dependent methyltransferase [Pirellulaceae bacterium]